MGGKVIEIDYSSQLAEYYIHRPLAHLELQDISTQTLRKFEIIDQGENHDLQVDGKVKSAWRTDDFMKLKKRLFIEISNTLYKKSTADWLSFVHASALTNGEKTMLLASPSGSGKSTMAALMQTRGFKAVSDDFVPIDAKSKKAHPFPAGISVKKSAFSVLSPYYEKLDTANSIDDALVRYIPTFDFADSEKNTRPVKEIIFIQYNVKADCYFQELSVVEALKLFHSQSWVSREPKHARSFINWFAKLKCYSLIYGDATKGMDVISELFKQQRDS
jgi:hypothetical protein